MTYTLAVLAVLGFVFLVTEIQSRRDHGDGYEKVTLEYLQEAIKREEEAEAKREQD